MEPGVAFHARRQFEEEERVRNGAAENSGNEKRANIKKRDPYKIVRNNNDDDIDDDEFDNLASISVFPVGPTRGNCVVIIDNEEGTLCVVNPGGDILNIVKEIKTLLAQVQLEATRLTHILLTSGHVGNMVALKDLKNLCDGSLDVCLHARDEFIYDRALLQATELGFEESLNDNFSPLPEINKKVSHGEILTCGRIKIKCLHTPGFSPGSMSYFFPQLNVACVGDTLMTNAVGRTSWMGIKSLEGTGNTRILRRSIDDILMEEVPSDATIIPGHGPLTTLRTENHRNAHLKTLSHRWKSYDESMEYKRLQEEAKAKMASDPFGDGLPF